jgi:flagellin
MKSAGAADHAEREKPPMSMSVNTNQAAMVALQNLNKTNAELSVAQNRINTGLKVTGAKDNSSTYAIAQNMRGNVGALNAVMQSVARASSVVDVALAAGEAISDLLVEMKEKAVAANDASLDTASRNALNEDFQALLNQIQSIVNNATFDGANLINGSLTNGLTVLADADAQSSITISSESMQSSGAIITLGSASGLTTMTNSQNALADVDASLVNVNAALARLGSAGKQLESHMVFVDKLQGQLRSGIGNLVDANLAEESAKLQALQVKQQLGVQALSIANNSPNIILSLFRS